MGREEDGGKRKVEWDGADDSGKEC